MKLKITPKEEPTTKGKKLKIKSGSETKSQYGKYSGIVNNEGKQVNNPTEVEAVKNMAQYMKNNNSPQSDRPSNVYRPEFSHISILYNPKKKQDNT